MFNKLLLGIFISSLLVVPTSYDYIFAQIDKISVVENSEMQKYMYLLEEYESLEYIQIPVGITLTRIGEIDREVGSYEADFWFWMEIFDGDSPVDFTENPPKFDFINAREVKLDAELIEPHFYEVRVRGTFFNEMDFTHYPFEKLNLLIEVEPQTPNDISQWKFVLDPTSEIDVTAKVPGWKTGAFEISTIEHSYDEDETFSRFTANFIVERSVTGSIVKNILPVSLITGLSLLIFFIPENFTPRIYLTAPLLLSLVYLHQGALDEIPPVGYMTIFDKIMVINFALFVNAILSLAIQMKFHAEQKTHLVKRTNSIMRLLIPVIIALGLVFIISDL